MNKIIIRVGEIWIKGKNRKEFMNKLKSNLVKSLSELNVTVIDARDKFVIEYGEIENKAQIHNVLSRTFGIEFYSDLVQMETNIEAISKATTEFIKENPTFLTFKVESKRKDKKFNLDSNQIKRMVATDVLKNVENIKVDLHNPDVVIYINVDTKYTDVYFGKIKGPGGLPAGSNGKVLLMLSGGIDSPVAALELMKRGMSVDCLTFLTDLSEDNVGYKKIINIFNHLKIFDPNMKHYFVNFSIVQEALYSTTNERYRITLLRRAYVRAAESIAKSKYIKAIATGDALGQVASQTLESLLCVTNASTTLILRPLLTRNKEEIITLSRKYGLYDLSIADGEDMCLAFAPAQPVTKPKLGVVKELEEEISSLDSSLELSLNTLKEVN